jgi:hypothetical protein
MKHIINCVLFVVIFLSGSSVSAQMIDKILHQGSSETYMEIIYQLDSAYTDTDYVTDNNPLKKSKKQFKRHWLHCNGSVFFHNISNGPIGFKNFSTFTIDIVNPNEIINIVTPLFNLDGDMIIEPKEIYTGLATYGKTNRQLSFTIQVELDETELSKRLKTLCDPTGYKQISINNFMSDSDIFYTSQGDKKIMEHSEIRFRYPKNFEDLR